MTPATCPGFDLQDTSSPPEASSLTGWIKKTTTIVPQLYHSSSSTAVSAELLKVSCGSNACAQLGEEKLILIQRPHQSFSSVPHLGQAHRGSDLKKEALSPGERELQPLLPLLCPYGTVTFSLQFVLDTP